MQRCYEGNFFLIGYFEKNGRVLLERAGFHRSLLEAHSVSLPRRQGTSQKNITDLLASTEAGRVFSFLAKIEIPLLTYCSRGMMVHVRPVKQGITTTIEDTMYRTVLENGPKFKIHIHNPYFSTLRNICLLCTPVCTSNSCSTRVQVGITSSTTARMRTLRRSRLSRPLRAAMSGETAEGAGRERDRVLVLLVVEGGSACPADGTVLTDHTNATWAYGLECVRKWLV